MLEHAQLTRPRHGEALSGDAAFVGQVGETLPVATVDVLGHGRGPHELAVPAAAFPPPHPETHAGAAPAPTSAMRSATAFPLSPASMSMRASPAST